MKIYNSTSEAALTEQTFQFNPSFGPYILTLRDRMEHASETNAKFYRYLIKKFEQEPSLLVPFKNVEVLEGHEELVELLQMSLMPLSADAQNYCMALAFMQPNCLFFYTPSFKRTFIEQHVEFDTDEDKVGHLRYFVKLVLQRCYHIETEDNPPVIKQVYNAQSHTISHYELKIESRFIHVHSKGELPAYNKEWQMMLQANDEEFTDMFENFPSQNFSLEGFCMLVTEDVSRNVAIAHLQHAVLRTHTAPLEETLENAELAIRELMNDMRINIGITPFFKINNKVVYDRSFISKCVGISSEENSLHGITIQDVYNKFAENPQPYIVSHIDEEFLRTRPYLSGLHDNEIKSLLVLPIETHDGLMGLFEAGISEDGFMTTKILDVLQPAIPLITDLIYYMIEMFEYKIDRLVKEKFTPLQKSVEWKFNEVAWEYLLHEGDKKNDESVGSVVFEEVHPLYGAVDIRDSSIKRNLAVKNDLIIQLRETIALLDNISKEVSLPLLESIQYKCSRYLTSLQDDLSSDDELQISEFLTNDVVDLFKSITKKYPRFREAMDSYVGKMDREVGEFHHHRIAYDASFQKVNKKIVTYFEQEAERLQAIYPFYFEKYRTDGVEYNIYMGQSIAPNQPFDIIYLKNIRLWQITAMAHVALLNHNMLDSLPVPLQTTQLILVHGYPIDISFRKDERRFDVEGSYNIRYEMLKKRIDKVRIKDTLERLTQPDKISIVYSDRSEAVEYLGHINFLKEKGVLADDLEMLELEDLQGVIGLKALRVGVNSQ